MIYLKLFYTYLKIGFFGFGGGYAMLSLIHNEVVANNGWMTDAEFADIVAVSQITPGPIAINSATYTGYTVTGNVWGSLLGTVAVCMPALTIMMLVTRFYLRLRGNVHIARALGGMKPMVVGMILAATLMLMGGESFAEWKDWLFFAVCVIASASGVSPIRIILFSALGGIILYA